MALDRDRHQPGHRTAGGDAGQPAKPPARSTDFCPRLITFTTEEDGQEQVAPCGSPLTVVADGASVCQAGHRYATCAGQQPDCTGWKAISVGEHYPGVIP